MNEDSDILYYKQLIHFSLQSKIWDENDFSEYSRGLYFRGFFTGLSYGIELQNSYEATASENEFDIKELHSDESLFDYNLNKLSLINTSNGRKDMTDIENIVIECMSQAEELERVYIHEENNEIHVLSVVSNADMNQKEKIFNRELDVFNRIPDLVFHFKLIDRTDRSIEDFNLTSLKCIYNRMP